MGSRIGAMSWVGARAGVLRCAGPAARYLSLFGLSARKDSTADDRAPGPAGADSRGGGAQRGTHGSASMRTSRPRAAGSASTGSCSWRFMSRASAITVPGRASSVRRAISSRRPRWPRCSAAAWRCSAPRCCGSWGRNRACSNSGRVPARWPRNCSPNSNGRARCRPNTGFSISARTCANASARPWSRSFRTSCRACSGSIRCPTSLSPA